MNLVKSVAGIIAAILGWILLRLIMKGLIVGLARGARGLNFGQIMVSGFFLAVGAIPLWALHMGLKERRRRGQVSSADQAKVELSFLALFISGDALMFGGLALSAIGIRPTVLGDDMPMWALGGLMMFAVLPLAAIYFFARGR
jgi:hypothetical protein